MIVMTILIEPSFLPENLIYVIDFIDYIQSIIMFLIFEYAYLVEEIRGRSCCTGETIRGYLRNIRWREYEEIYAWFANIRCVVCSV